MDLDRIRRVCRRRGRCWVSTKAAVAPSAPCDAIECVDVLPTVFGSEAAAKAALARVHDGLRVEGLFYGAFPNNKQRGGRPFGTAAAGRPGEWVVHASVLRKLAEHCGLQHVVTRKTPTRVLFVFRRPWV